MSGLSAAELSSLRDRFTTGAEWTSLLKVFVGDPGADWNGLPPEVLGRYAVTGSAVTFTPLFPFDPGRPYQVMFDPARLPRPRPADIVTATVQLPSLATEPSTLVTAVHPSSDVVPENLLRIYIEFSAPMGNGSALDFVRLVELSEDGRETGQVDRDAFLPVEADFWSPDHRRYTLFFDPGRVKADILPNRQRGRPLRAGHRYALDIAAGWTDANGLPLKARHRHVFHVGPAVDKAIDLSGWKIAPPAARTRSSLTVAFPRPLDHGILARALNVEKEGTAVPGVVSVEAHDARWAFTPAAPWEPGEYNLIAWSFLEDPQGNQIGRAFEAPADQRPAPRAPEAFRVAFTIGHPR